MNVTKELKYLSESQIKRTLVLTEKGEWEVSTVLLNDPLARFYDTIFGFADASKTPYETMIFKYGKGKRISPNDYGHVRYCLKEDAIQGHGKVVEGIKRGKIIPQQSLVNDFSSLCSPWCSV